MAGNGVKRKASGELIVTKRQTLNSIIDIVDMVCSVRPSCADRTMDAKFSGIQRRLWDAIAKARKDFERNAQSDILEQIKKVRDGFGFFDSYNSDIAYIYQILKALRHWLKYGAGVELCDNACTQLQRKDCAGVFSVVVPDSDAGQVLRR